MAKRVLIITYYWPPAGGPGVQRWLMFAKYFKRFGIEPVVYIPEKATYPIIDEDLRTEVDPDLEIISTPVKEPYKWAQLFSKKQTKQLSRGIISSSEPGILEKLLMFIRGNFFIPDARVGWVAPSISFLTDYLENNNIDAIVTTGPPHSLHLIGMELKKSSSLPWLADFRDPWTTIHYHKKLRLTPAANKKHQQLERQVLTTADQIVVTSPTTKSEFEAITTRPIEVITNGYDKAPWEKPPLDDHFTLAHIGSLLSERNPVILWEVLSELLAEGLEDLDQKLQIKLAGAVSEEVFRSIEAYGLAPYLNHLGYISHEEALQEQAKSQVLLIIEMDTPETCAIIPGKLFEYMAAQRPVIALGPYGSDMDALLKESGVGRFFDYSEKGHLKRKIRQLYERFLKQDLNVSQSDISQFSRERLTENMATLLKKML